MTAPALRPLSTEGFPHLPAMPDVGAAPMLQWIPVEHLVVDDRYQRPIRDQGRRNVARIAERFRWSNFAPVVVSPVAGGRYSIIDGQHRATAAMIVGHASVPCQVVIADTSEQAAAFRAINGAVTKMSALTIHHAAVAAEDPEALLVEDACRRADVIVLRSHKMAAQMGPGETQSIKAIASCFKQYGRDTLVTALKCITETENNTPGTINGVMVKALCSVLHAHLAWRDAGGALFDAMDKLPLAELEEKARTLAARRKGATTITILIEMLVEALASRLGPGVKA